MNIIEMNGISKRFGNIVANNNIDLSIKAGEIHCLLGENGAGKSTLVKILFGLYKADKGNVKINGEAVHFHGPSEAINRGIGMIHQHFMLVGRLTVTENIIAGAEITKGRFIDYEKANREIKELAEKYGFRINPENRVEDISVGEQQRVEILKALYRHAEILILDEPTAVLTPQETEELFKVIRELKAAGKTIILITHKLMETMEISDRVTILRDGRKIDTVETSTTSPQQLANKMVGRQVLLSVDKKETTPGEEVLAIKGLSLTQGNNAVLKDISLSVRKGEILGIAGVEGNGQLELEEVIVGLMQANKGSLKFLGEELLGKSVRARRDLGIAHIPSDRLKRGLIEDLSVAKNILLGSQWHTPFSKQGFFNNHKISEYCAAIIDKYDIRGASPSTRAGGLSGGNQQKLVIGRELSRNPKFILASQPTRGVDVGAIEYIHQQLVDMKAAGKAVLLISAELDEIRSLSDRIMVIYEGKVVASGNTNDFTESELGLLMAGHSLEGEEHGQAISS